jgi:serine/threonine-protein kinase
VYTNGKAGASPPMTPERWRAVDAILQGALVCDRDRRDRFVQDACGEDEALRHEVASLLAAHDTMAAGFLEGPPVHSFGDPPAMPVPNERRSAALAEALAGRYEVAGEIARGGMSSVYVARDVRHGRRVAIKVMRDEVAAVVGAERFLEEIRVTALLQHPHILPLFDSGNANGLLWYAMPFVEGETLRSRLRREGRLPVEEAVRLAREIAEALDHAHARGIVHRDVKPENILLQGGHALVADFGIALALEQAGGERLTRTGLTLGTPQYMAPEQAAGERALDARVDVYALGAVVHEMLVGEPPFAEESRQVALQRILLEPPATLTTRRADVSTTLDSAVRRALAKRSGERFPTAGAFAAALAAPPIAADQESLRAAELHPPRKTVRAAVAVYAAVAGIAVGLIGGWGLAHSPTARWSSEEPVVANQESANPSIVLPDARSRPGVASKDGLSLVVVDRTGRVQRTIDADRPWTPRFSPDGRRVAYGAFGEGRSTSDLWVTDLDAGTTRRLTDDDGDNNDPQWSADGSSLAYSVSAPGGKDVATMRLWGGASRIVASRPGTQFPSDWLRDGSALIVTQEDGAGHDILVQPADGSPAHPYASTAADELAGRVSPDGHWLAYTSDESGRGEVYLDSYPRPGRRMMISVGGGFHPVWRGDGRELYYWHGDALVAVEITPAHGDASPTAGAQTVLFRAQYPGGVSTMYDVSPDGRRFVIVERR